MKIDDTIYEIGSFLNSKELFIFGRISKSWYKNLEYHKKKYINKIYAETAGKHYCSNMCPCAIVQFYESLMKDFFLKRYVCRHIEGKSIPNWLSKYLQKK